MNNNFDFLRFTLAFMVVLAHLITLSDSVILRPLDSYVDSYVSVTGFFVISGFLITKSYIGTSNPRAYFVKRLKRLLPGYLVVIFLSGVCLSLLSSLDAITYFKHPDLLKYFFYNSIFLNFLSPCLPGVFTTNNLCAINGSLWTIKVEVGFYILIPFLAHMFNKLDKKITIFICIYVGSLLYKYIINYYLEQTGDEIFNTLSHQLPAFMTYFACGIAFNYYLAGFLKNKAIYLFLAIPVFWIESYLALEIFRPIALSVIIFYIAYSLKGLNNFGKNGDLSYGVYIYHFPIIQFFVSLGFFERFNHWLLSIAIILLVLVTAFLSWHLLEKRFLNRRV